MKLKIKPQYKVVGIVLAAVLIVTATFSATLAWLTSTTETVTNTFTYGKVEITMDEAVVDAYGVPENQEAVRDTRNEYKLIPGHTYTKDPTIHVGADSENCFLFVEIDNGLGSAASFTLTDLPAESSVTNATAKWTKYDAESDGTKTVYYLPTAVLPGVDVEVFPEFTFSGDVGSANDPISNYEGKEITLTAYAIQAEGFANDDFGMTSVETCWKALGTSKNNQ